MSEELKITDLQEIDPKTLPELSGWEEKQLAIVKENPFVEILDNETYEVAKKHRTALVSARTDIQKQDKLIASKLKEFRTKVSNVSQELIEITLPHETKQQEEVKKYEEEKERIKAEKEEKERQRIIKIRQKIDEFEGEVNKMTDQMTFEKIDVTINGAEHFLAECKSDFNFEEFQELFVEAGSRAMRGLNEKVKVLQEKEKQRLENERLAKEAEEANKKAELQSKRIGELLPYHKYFDASIAPTLGGMSEEDYLKIWNGAINKKAEQDHKDAIIKNQQRLQSERLQAIMPYNDSNGLLWKGEKLDLENLWNLKDDDFAYMLDGFRKLHEQKIEEQEEKERLEVEKQDKLKADREQLEKEKAEWLAKKNQEDAEIIESVDFNSKKPIKPEHLQNALDNALAQKRVNNEKDVVEEVDFEWITPKMLEDEKIDFTALKKICQDYMNYVDSEDYHEDNDYSEYIYEAAIEAFFGKNAWDYINKMSQ